MLLRTQHVIEDCVQAYADENGLTYWETSAKSNTNVNDLFVDIAKRLPRVIFSHSESLNPCSPDYTLQMS